MTETIEHDRLSKELLSTFFFEFLELFLPDLVSTAEANRHTVEFPN